MAITTNTLPHGSPRSDVWAIRFTPKPARSRSSIGSTSSRCGSSEASSCPGESTASVSSATSTEDLSTQLAAGEEIGEPRSRGPSFAKAGQERLRRLDAQAKCHAVVVHDVEQEAFGILRLNGHGRAASGRLQGLVTRRYTRRCPGLQSQVPEDLLDHRLFQDRRDDLQLAAAVRAVLQVDLESAASAKTNLYSSHVAAKFRRAVGTRSVHPVQHQAVQVDVQVGG